MLTTDESRLDGIIRQRRMQTTGIIFKADDDDQFVAARVANGRSVNPQRFKTRDEARLYANSAG